MAPVDTPKDCWELGFGKDVPRPEWLKSSRDDRANMKAALKIYRTVENLIETLLSENGLKMDSVDDYGNAYMFHVGDILVGKIANHDYWLAKVDIDFVPKVMTPGGLRVAYFEEGSPIQVWRKK